MKRVSTLNCISRIRSPPFHPATYTVCSSLVNAQRALGSLIPGILSPCNCSLTIPAGEAETSRFNSEACDWWEGVWAEMVFDFPSEARFAGRPTGQESEEAD
jgi:hypothetical protein